MRFTSRWLLLFAFAAPLSPAHATETIVFIRHGEKPEPGKGQINCQGLNRALALPKILFSKFGKPDAIFAPNPGKTKKDQGISYHYIRPLATIEPTAIKADLPVNVAWGLDEVAPLEKALLDAKYEDATIFVAWEHRMIDVIARDLLTQFGADPAQIPEWQWNDFDSIYIVKISKDEKHKKSASFKLDKQDLNDLPKVCPE